MRFLFLNQYGPPDPAPTARLLDELSQALRSGGHEVETVAQSQSYHGRPTRGGRLKRELHALWAILRAGWSPRSGRPDVVLALSSPPGLPVVGVLLAWRHRARLAHWAMDLYPELALVLGEIRAGGPVAWGVQAAMRHAYRRAALVVALDEDMRVYLQSFCRCSVRILEPWPDREIEQRADNLALAPDPFADEAALEPWTWLYSGNLGRAHEWQTLLDAQALLEARGLPVRLVFQGDGAARAPAIAYAEKLGLGGCAWKPYAEAGALLPALLRASVLVVTQRPETRGLLWPSKLALLERLPRPILFVGPEDGAIAGRLRERGNVAVFPPGQAGAVSRWVEEVFNKKETEAGPALRPRLTSVEQSGRLQRWLAECGEGKAC